MSGRFYLFKIRHSCKGWINKSRGTPLCFLSTHNPKLLILAGELYPLGSINRDHTIDLSHFFVWSWTPKLCCSSGCFITHLGRSPAIRMIALVQYRPFITDRTSHAVSLSNTAKMILLFEFVCLKPIAVLAVLMVGSKRYAFSEFSVGCFVIDPFPLISL